MKKQIAFLEEILEVATDEILLLDEAEFSRVPQPGKWSKKLILGHLCDSAFNNIQRFIRAQYESGLKIVYDQDKWVELQHYDLMSRYEILELWKCLNKRILAIWKSIPEENLLRTCDTGKREVQIHTLHFLIEDYVDHLKYHLKQITGG